MRTLNEIREVGLAVLSSALGPADTIRFIQQYERGSGDYTAERDRLLGNPTVDELLKDIKRRRAAKEGASPLKRPRVASGKTKTTRRKQQASTTH